jgi:transposase
VPQTTWPYNRPEIGKQLAYKANRIGGTERVPDPAVQKSVAVDLARIDYYDPLLRDVELPSVQTATPHHAQPLDRLQAIPGSGKLLSVVLLYAMHDFPRFLRVQAFVSSCPLVTGAKDSAGKRDGTSGATIGTTYLTWAFSEAAVLFLRNHLAAQKCLARLEPKHGKGKALTILAHKLARAVYDRLKRDTVFDMQKFLNG